MHLLSFMFYITNTVISGVPIGPTGQFCFEKFILVQEMHFHFVYSS